VLNLPTRDDLPENAFTVSRSRLATWSKCQYRHYLNYTLEKRSSPSQAMQLGTMIHAILEKYYQFWLGNPVGEMSVYELEELIAPLMTEATTYEEQLLWMRAATVCARYPEYAEIHDNWIPVGTEVETFAPLIIEGSHVATPDGRPIYLHAILDLIVDQDGQMGFVDHKSGGQFWKPETAYFDNQLAFYFTVLHRIFEQ